MPQMPPLNPATTTTVAAEDAPIGVQIWPTIRPDAAPMYTLRTVKIVRVASGSFVEWTFENGSQRVFRPGTQVAIDIVPNYGNCRDCGVKLTRKITAGCPKECDRCKAKSLATSTMICTGSVSATTTYGDATYAATR